MGASKALRPSNFKLCAMVPFGPNIALIFKDVSQVAWGWPG